MKKAKNMSNKLIAILLSAAMTFTPMLQSMPVYAAETETEIEAETLGVMPEADVADVDDTALDTVSDNEDTVSDNEDKNEDQEEAAAEEQVSDEVDVDDTVQDDAVSEDDSKDNVSDVEKDADTEEVEEKTETKTETKSEETVSLPVYEEEVVEEESATGSEEESETEVEEMSQEEIRASFSITASDVKAGGWNESIYAEIPKVTDASAITEVSWTGTMDGKLDEDGLKYLVRTIGADGTRIDIPGLKAGTYELSITVNGTSGAVKKSGITVSAYDRSGYAHFNYTDGVGAYKDDGTLKDNAIVIYVTDENKNTVELKDPKTGTTVNGIGNILNTVGKECGEAGHPNECKTTSKGKTYYGKANGNKGIIQKLSEADTPLVVRFVGVVSDSGLYKQGSFNASSSSLIEGLTAYNKVDYGGTVGDNGHMARMKSGKNITLEGIGYDATIDGWGFHFMCESANSQYGKSFEVRNLTFINTPEDAIGMEGVQEGGKITASVERCWVHNNEFYCPNIGSPAESDKAQGDGSVDFKRGQYFTCSYNYYEGCHKTNLIGSSDSSLQFNLTYHHNRYRDCESRGPLARQANIHMYNNIYEYQSSYAMNTRANAYIFSEYNMFYMVKNPMDVAAGAIKSYHDSLTSCINSMSGTVVTDKNQKVSNACKYLTTDLSSFDTDSTLSYIPSNKYKLDTNFTELRKVVKSQTGVQARNPKLPENISASEYTVIPDGTTVNSITSLPATLTPGKIEKKVYAFSVTGAVDVEVDYAVPSGIDSGVLVNEAGENLLEGNGSVVNLPMGTYWIQTVNCDPSKHAFKSVTINSLKITAHDPNAHYHNWELDSAASKDATCTEAGKKVYKCTGSGTCDANGTKEETIEALGHSYTILSATTKPATCTEAGVGTYKCSRCDSTNEGSIPALGHSWGNWEVVTPATSDTPGQERRTCTRCTQTETRPIPAGGTGGGSSGGNVTVGGDYVLYFTGGQPNGDTDFFQISGKYKTGNTPITVNGEEYTDGLKMESSTKLSFSCNEGSTLYMVFFETGKKVKVDGTSYSTDDPIKVENLTEGTHTIEKDSTNTTLGYLSVANKASDEAVYTLSFVYNYDGNSEEDEPEPITVDVLDGQVYASMTALVPASFTRTGYKLKGLYTDADCTAAVTYPYVVNGSDTFYAEWEEDDTPVVETWTLFFKTNGGVGIVPVSVSKTQIYEIKQIPTRDGYVFAGWYDAPTDGKLIDKIDGSTMTGDMTVYAYWNPIETVKLSLDCSKLTDGNITEKTNLNGSGFIAHVLPGGKGTAGEENPKYYMTVKNGGLYTNGVRLTDTSIAGNEDGLLKTIEFTTEGSGVLSVTFALSNKSETGKTYNLVLAKKSADGSLEEVFKSPITTSDAKTTKEFDIAEAGTYYLYAEGDKGVVYYSMKVTEQVYTVIWQVGKGTVPEDINLDSITAKEGEEIEIPADCTPASGYIFKGWSADDGATLLKKADVYKVKEDDATGGQIVIAAIYEAMTYTLRYDANGGTLPSGTQETTTVKTGDQIALGNCTPAEGYKFVGWSLGHSSELVVSPYIVNLADADDNMTITLKAVYAPEGETLVYYTVTLDTDGGTLVDGGGRQRRILANTTIDPGKCEKVGYVFKGWTVDGEDIKTPYTVTKDVTFKAKYGLSGNDKDMPAEYIYIIGLESSYPYTGAKIVPDIEVWDYDIPGGKLLAPGTDYTVAYKNNVKAGENTAEVTVTGKGNYAGKDVSKRFSIMETTDVTENLAELKGAKIADKIADMPYTGEAQYPAEFTITKKDKSTVKYIRNTDAAAKGLYKREDNAAMDVNIAVSNNVNKGTATILVTGAADAKGRATSVKKTFKITALDLSANADKVTVEPMAAVEYAVSGAVPASLTVKYDGKTLKQGKDYTVKYANNKKAGKGTATITGKGNYAKKYPTPVEYTIDPLDLSNGLTVNAVTVYGGIKAGKVKATVADRTGTALKASQYEVKVYKAAEGDDVYGADEVLEEGMSVYVSAEAKDTVNLKEGTATPRAVFKVGKDISKAKFTVKKGVVKAYTGSEVKLVNDDLEVTIKGEAAPLEMGKDYVVAAYANNINKGTATAVIKGIGNYSGTKIVKFKITQKSMTIGKTTPWDKVSWTLQNFANLFTK